MAEDTLDRPAIGGMSEDAEGFAVTRLSKLALVSFITGLVGLFAPYSLLMLPFCMVAAATGLLALILHAKNDLIAGKLLAQLGCMFGVAAFVWAIVASKSHTQMLTEEAAANAQIYLNLVSGGDEFQVLELRKPIRSRQIAGTDLTTYYDSLKTEEKERITQMLKSGAMKLVRDAGPEANWVLHRLVEVNRSSSDRLMVKIEMQEEQSTDKKVVISLERVISQVGDDPPTADWNIGDVSLPK